MKLLHRAAIILILLTTVVGLAISWTCPLYPNPCSACSGYVVSATGIKLCRNIYLGEDQEYYGCCEYQIQWLQCINANPPGYLCPSFGLQEWHQFVMQYSDDFYCFGDGYSLAPGECLYEP